MSLSTRIWSLSVWLLLLSLPLTACVITDSASPISDGDLEFEGQGDGDVDADADDDGVARAELSCPAGRIGSFAAGRNETTGYIEGVCSFAWAGDAMPAIYRQAYVASLNEEAFNDVRPAGQCGVCYQVSGPEGDAVVMVMDVCTIECCENCRGDVLNLNLEHQVIDEMASKQTGNIPTNYREVPCPVSGDIGGVVVGEFVDDYYVELAFFNHRVGLDKVEVKAVGPGLAYKNPWITLPATENNRFVWSTDLAEAGRKPEIFNGGTGVIFRLTSRDGLVIETQTPLEHIENGYKFDLGVQFDVPADEVPQDAVCTWDGPSEWVYKDGLQGVLKLMWTDWGSFDLVPERANYAYEEGCHTGDLCIDGGVFRPYGGLQIGFPMAYPGDHFSGIDLWARSAVQGETFYGLAIQFHGFDENGEPQASERFPLGQIDDDWTLLSLDIKASDLPSLVQFFVLLNNSDGESPQLIFDDIRFLR